MFWKNKSQSTEANAEFLRSVQGEFATTQKTEPSAVPLGGQKVIESPDSLEQPPVTPSDVEIPVSEDDQREIRFQEIKEQVHQRVINQIDLSVVATVKTEELRFEVFRVTEMMLEEQKNQLTDAERERLINEVIDETFGLGPLEPLFRDTTISDIMINGSRQVYIERGGRLEQCKVKFNNDQHLIRILQRIVSAVGRRIDETSPMVDARLADGSRVNAVIPPLALDGPLVSIRRFGQKPLKAEDLLAKESMTPEMLTFLGAAVAGRLNIIISGGTGSGKTTLLNVLSGYIPVDERVATIEDAAELQLQQPHVIRMETRPKNIEGQGEVSTRDLVKNALRMRPDRIVVGECRGPEAVDMLQAMNTGHDGSLTTVHANTPRDAMSRLEMMVGMAGIDVPIWTIRKQMASAVNLVIQATRLTGGPRKITCISEITGMEGDVISMHDIFRFRQTGLDEQRQSTGYFEATGIRPKCLERLESAGLPLSLELFEQRILNPESPGEHEQ